MRLEDEVEQCFNDVRETVALEMTEAGATNPVAITETATVHGTLDALKLLARRIETLEKKVADLTADHGASTATRASRRRP